jgi:hypothetical protein
MIDEFVEWLSRLRTRIYWRLPFEFLDPRSASIRTEAGREARRAFEGVYEGERKVNWPCFVEFLQNYGRLRGPDKLASEWARWVVEYESSLSPSELLRNSMRERFMADSPPCDMMDRGFGYWFDFGGYLHSRGARSKSRSSAADRPTDA